MKKEKDMEAPNDIDYAIIEARLEGMNTMYLAAVEAYRQGIIDTLCKFAREFVPGAHAVRLIGDVDWRWTCEAFVDENNQEIEPGFGDDFYFEDLFSSAYLSELPETQRIYGFVYVAEREFSDLDPAEWAERKRADSLTSEAATTKEK